jgi:hypothetical protein
VSELKKKKVKIFDIYEGMFSQDQMEGEGIYKYANGDTISGIFSKNKLNGIGTARNGYIDKNYGYIVVDGNGILCAKLKG